jgi:hypothetical protein
MRGRAPRASTLELLALRLRAPIVVAKADGTLIRVRRPLLRFRLGRRELILEGQLDVVDLAVLVDAFARGIRPMGPQFGSLGITEPPGGDAGMSPREPRYARPPAPTRARRASGSRRARRRLVQPRHRPGSGPVAPEPRRREQPAVPEHGEHVDREARGAVLQGVRATGDDRRGQHVRGHDVGREHTDLQVR